MPDTSAAVQTTYAANQAEATAGFIANMRECDTERRSCETVAGIGFGLAVGQGSANKGGVLGGDLEDFQGVSIRDVTLDPQNSDKYAHYDDMTVLKKGPIWVQISEAVAVTDAVYFNATTGIFLKTAGAGVEGPVKGARWVKAATSGIALLHLSGYNQDAA